MDRFERIMCLVAVAGTILSGTNNQIWAGDDLSGDVKIDGSSTVYPITEAVAEDFGGQNRKVRVIVGISGTGGGFKRFASGETDVSNASRPITKEEANEAVKNKVEYIELPIAYDGLSIVVNKDNDWCNDLTVDEIKAIFTSDSKVKSWKDVRPEWPDVAMKIYAPGTDSGTFDYFKEVTVGKNGNIRADMSVSEDDNVLVRGVAGDKGAIGFFGYAYYMENQDKIKAVAVNGVRPDLQTIETGTYSPFSRPLFIYINTGSLDKPQVARFVEYYLENGPTLVEEVGYIKLPSTIYNRAKTNLTNKRVGTQYMDPTGESRQGPLADIYH